MDEAERRRSIDSWLASTGFPVEHAAVRTLEKVGFGVDAARFYRSSPTADRREVDAVARTHGPRDRSPNVVRLVVECKYAARPWIILTRRRAVRPADVIGWAIASDEAHRIVTGRAERVARTANATAGVPSWITSTPEVHGASIVAQPVSSPTAKDAHAQQRAPHQALEQLLDAAQAIRDEADTERAVSWPLLVVRGELYQAKLDDNGDLRSEPIEWQRIVWGGVTGQPVVIDIVRERHLEVYARLAHVGLMTFEEALDSGFGEGEV